MFRQRKLPASEIYRALGAGRWGIELYSAKNNNVDFTQTFPRDEKNWLIQTWISRSDSKIIIDTNLCRFNKKQKKLSVVKVVFDSPVFFVFFYEVS